MVNTPFGRDGLITGLETLWITPELARGVLAYLSATQATVVDPMQDAEPGKILHETRSGEMAALHEMPFGRYYGTVDGPPLFVFLAGAYLLRSGNTAFIGSIWDSIVKSLEWISTYGDRDGDGFLEYESHCEGGLIHQAWKDSDDAIFHANGETAVGPLAICEVQGYCFAAYRMAAEMASALNQPEEARRWEQKANTLYNTFNQNFWCDSLKTYGIALDGSKSLCCVSASNAGQLLFSGIVPPERATLLANSLINTEQFSGWGIRTLSNTSARFNPMSYHNGTVWPHDNAVIAYGLSLCGLKPQANAYLSGHLRCRHAVPSAEASRALLRLRAGRRLWPHSLSRRLLPPGMVCGRCIALASGFSGDRDRWPKRTDSFSPSHPSGFFEGGVYLQPLRRRKDHESRD